MFVGILCFVVFFLAVCFLGFICWMESEGYTFSDLFPGKDKDQKEWRMFHCRKPDKVGWYLCTVEQGSRVPMLLYWEVMPGRPNADGRFIDPVRKSVFDTYEVMVTKKFEEGMATDAIMPNDEYMERIYTDEACDRTKYVIAWKPEPKVFMGMVQNERNTGKERANPVTIDTGLRANFANLSYADIEHIVNEYNKLGNVNVVTADELKAALARATEMKAYDLEGNVVAEFDRTNS